MVSDSPSTPATARCEVLGSRGEPWQCTRTSSIRVEAGLEAIAQRREQSVPRVELRRRVQRRLAEADDRRHVLGRGAAAPLLTAAQQQRGELELGTHPQRRGAQRSVELVRADGQ